MNIRLDLSKHCIETELKRLHNKAISMYFQAVMEEKHPLEKTIEMLHQALETLDFGHLRAKYPTLAGGTNQKIILSVVNDHLVITMGDKELTRVSIL